MWRAVECCSIGWVVQHWCTGARTVVWAAAFGTLRYQGRALRLCSYLVGELAGLGAWLSMVDDANGWLPQLWCFWGAACLFTCVIPCINMTVVGAALGVVVG